MSTGYYIRVNCCPSCGRSTSFKIAHQAHSWRTLFFKIDDLKISCFADLERVVTTVCGSVVHDEYGRHVSWEEFRSQSMGNQGKRTNKTYISCLTDEQGFEFDPSYSVSEVLDPRSGDPLGGRP